jgi:hypothetical protein
VYGATPAGITAAIAAQEEGASVLLVEPGRWVGGMFGAGIKITQDCPEPRAIGGLTKARVFSFARKKPPETPAGLRANFKKWLADERIPVVYERRVVSAEKSGGALVSARFEGSPPDALGVPPPQTTPDDADVVFAKVFIDASYEGDLMKLAGVSYAIGREAASTYGEKPAGVNPAASLGREAVAGQAGSSMATDNWAPIDPCIVPGDPSSGLLPHVEADHGKPPGSADDYTQAYNFRFYVTSDPARRADFGKPADYDPAQYELAGRFVEYLKATCKGRELGARLEWIFPGWRNREDYNYHRRSLVTIAPLGVSRFYQDGDWATRSAIWQQHIDYLAGLRYFLMTDPRTPPRYREKITALGLDKTIYPDTQGWPQQLYVRIARRMSGRYVVTHKDVLNQTSPEDGIGLALYGVDTYPARRHAATRNGRPGVVTEGNMFLGGAKGTSVPYPIPYRAITPVRDECANLLVPVCFSASYIAYASARMEPVFSVLGESAGVAAAISIREKKPVQDIDVPALQARLRERGQILEWRHERP